MQTVRSNSKNVAKYKKTRGLAWLPLFFIHSIASCTFRYHPVMHTWDRIGKNFWNFLSKSSHTRWVGPHLTSIHIFKLLLELSRSKTILIKTIVPVNSVEDLKISSNQPIPLFHDHLTGSERKWFATIEAGTFLSHELSAASASWSPS